MGMIENYWVSCENVLSKRGFWHVDLAFTVEQVHINTARDNLTVSGWVEDVADSLSLGEWMIGHLDFFGVSGVGQGNEELAS